jgi:hypothetical protein
MIYIYIYFVMSINCLLTSELTKSEEELDSES